MSYGHTLGRTVGLAGYVGADQVVDADWVVSGTYTVEVACARQPVTVSRPGLVRPRERAHPALRVRGSRGPPGRTSRRPSRQQQLGGTQGTAYATTSPTTMEATANPDESQSATKGLAVRRRAAPAGADSRPSRSSAPTACVASAAVAPTRARKPTSSGRTRTPRAAATAESKVAKSNGSLITTTRQTSATVTRGHGRLAETEPEDRAEEDAHAGRSRLGGLRRGRVAEQREYTEAEHPGEDRADHDVVLTATIPSIPKAIPIWRWSPRTDPTSGRCRSQGPRAHR